MIRTMLAFLGLAAIAAPAAAADRRYSITDFDRVVVEGPYIVRLTLGRPSYAAASGTREGIDRVTVDVQGQTLRIRRNRSGWGGTPGADSGPVTIALATRNLRSARLIGPATLDVEGARGLNVQFTVEGSGRVRAANVAADNLSLGLLGSGRLEISGTARALRADVQGTGDVEASRLIAQNATLVTTTAGTVALTVNGPATVAANGLGDVNILGR
ncbi:MAG TPA: DUF2807 domain-containing protein, partial [Allosphingosinicella sp.]|nr:DUF2807 domain-containing protein [Allosphingosinicella sp.]